MIKSKRKKQTRVENIEEDTQGKEEDDELYCQTWLHVYLNDIHDNFTSISTSGPLAYTVQDVFNKLTVDYGDLFPGKIPPTYSTFYVAWNNADALDEESKKLILHSLARYEKNDEESLEESAETPTRNDPHIGHERESNKSDSENSSSSGSQTSGSTSDDSDQSSESSEIESQTTSQYPSLTSVRKRKKRKITQKRTKPKSKQFQTEGTSEEIIRKTEKRKLKRNTSQRGIKRTRSQKTKIKKEKLNPKQKKEKGKLKREKRNKREKEKKDKKTNKAKKKLKRGKKGRS